MGQPQTAVLKSGQHQTAALKWESIRQLSSCMGWPQTAVFEYGTASDSYPSVWDSLRQLVYGTVLDNCPHLWDSIGKLHLYMGQFWTAFLMYGTVSGSRP